jgi:hypothetical protein
LRIRITRSGGFAGVEENLGTIDTRHLDEETVRRVRDATAQLEVLAAKEQPVGADIFRYDIEVENDRGSRKLSIAHEGDPQVPLAQPLAALLKLAHGTR